jgi:ATP-dependent Clp protease, protease subunit
VAKINIKGVIISNDDQWIYDWLEMDATSPKSVQKQMDGLNGEELEVEINSGGGSVFDGSEIYTALKSYHGNVTVKIVGLAASAASVIAMAGNKIIMSPTSQMMIHNASVRASGDYRDMDHTSGILKNVNQTIANAYQLKSGLNTDTLLKMMDQETWLTPQQALEHGLIDEVMFENPISLVASYSNMLPQEVIDKIRNKIHPSNQKTDIFMQQKAKAQFNLLKLGGKDIE